VKHIKENCSFCKVKLNDLNWYETAKKKCYYICMSCYGLKNKSRVTIQGKRVQVGNALHPYYKIYKTNGVVSAYEAMGILTSQTNNNSLEFIKKESIAMFDKISHGEVYIITNPAWKGWLKIGMAIEAEDRLKGYQTSSPLRDFKLKFKKYFDNRRVAEQQAHALCAKKALKRKGEWFKVDFKIAKDIINNMEVV
tara:strand:+ start:53 stop:637 length:585 start_codon:yes stop_codon:yes gene_type:complete